GSSILPSATSLRPLAASYGSASQFFTGQKRSGRVRAKAVAPERFAEADPNWSSRSMLAPLKSCRCWMLQFAHVGLMNELSPQTEAVLEVIAPDSSRQQVALTPEPFNIGRGGEVDNALQLDDGRISRRCATIVAEGAGHRMQDRGNRSGVFVNGAKVLQHLLRDGDVITFGIDDSYQIVFHSAAAPVPHPPPVSVANLLTRIGSISDFTSTTGTGGLNKLNLLLEATSLLHSQLPLDSVLGTMLDHAISVTHADRGLLIEPDGSGALHVHQARSNKGEDLAPENLNPSQTAINQAISKQSSVITEDLNLAGVDLKAAASVVIQGLRAVVAVPLYASSRSTADTGSESERGQLLGVLYLDSRRRAAFSALDRQILDALAVQAASIMDNARLVERERERQRLEQELSIARTIQQVLLPHGLTDFPHLAVTGVHYPCHEVGGDYFDVVQVNEDRTAILIADVSGKGLGAALLTTMLQGALSGLTMGADPVKVFNHINRFLCRHAEVGRYATMFIGLLDNDGMLEYIKAGHPSPLLLRQGNVSELYTEGSFPVGLIPEAEYTSARLQLEPEDTLVLFSDGVTEAENSAHVLFEVTGLSQVLAGRKDVPVEELQQSVLDAVRDFTKSAEQSDDITLLVVRYREAA
ncbi:MAG: SpoIIE family protein phosphatase, partial [Terracidiphilus sp.]